jgi:hypothetical protein
MLIWEFPAKGSHCYADPGSEKKAVRRSRSEKKPVRMGCMAGAATVVNILAVLSMISTGTVISKQISNSRDKGEFFARAMGSLSVPAVLLMLGGWMRRKAERERVAIGQSRGPRAFLSYKSDPDVTRAGLVADEFSRHGIPTIFIRGDSACPHPFGSPEAEEWVEELLGGGLTAADVVVTIVSTETFKSRWVIWEYSRSLRFSHAQSASFILWFDGPEPVFQFMPSPRWLSNLIMPRPLWLVDCRDTPASGLEALAATLVTRAQRRIRLRLVVNQA